MAGVKEVNGKKLSPVLDKATLQSLVEEKYVSVPFVVPGWDVTVEISMLKRAEREAIVKAAQGDDGRWDNLLQNRMAAAFGLVNPTMTADELKDYPDSFIDPIANEVWKMSNTYDAKQTEEEREGSYRPFRKTSGSNTGLRTDSDASPTT